MIRLRESESESEIRESTLKEWKNKAGLNFTINVCDFFFMQCSMAQKYLCGGSKEKKARG